MVRLCRTISLSLSKLNLQSVIPNAVRNLILTATIFLTKRHYPKGRDCSVHVFLTLEDILTCFWAGNTNAAKAFVKSLVKRNVTP